MNYQILREVLVDLGVLEYKLGYKEKRAMDINKKILEEIDCLKSGIKNNYATDFLERSVYRLNSLLEQKKRQVPQRKMFDATLGVIQTKLDFINFLSPTIKDYYSAIAYKKENLTLKIDPGRQLGKTYLANYLASVYKAECFVPYKAMKEFYSNKEHIHIAMEAYKLRGLDILKKAEMIIVDEVSFLTKEELDTIYNITDPKLYLLLG